VKGREIGLFNVGGNFYALANRCRMRAARSARARWFGLVQSDGPGQTRSCAKASCALSVAWLGNEISTGQSWCDPRI